MRLNRLVRIMVRDDGESVTGAILLGFVGGSVGRGDAVGVGEWGDYWFACCGEGASWRWIHVWEPGFGFFRFAFAFEEGDEEPGCEDG